MPKNCLKSIFLFKNTIVIKNKTTMFKLITVEAFEGLFVFLNELYIQGSTIKYTINNLRTIVNKSL